MVEYSDRLVRRLEMSLRSALNPTVILSRPKNRGAAFQVSLCNGSQTAHTDEGPEQDVLEIVFKRSGEKTYRRSGFWFGVVALFAREESSESQSLQHSSIAVFHDIAGQLVPFFRAEWDQLDARQKSEHAQPHRHFDQRPAHIESILGSLTNTAVDFAPEHELPLLSTVPDCGRVHFAMTSLWEKHETPPYRKRLFDASEFPKWFDSLTKYIAGQIAYLGKHMPGADTPEAFS